MRNIFLSTSAVVALTIGAASAFAQTPSPGSSQTAPGQVKPPATSSEAPGRSESAPGQNRPSASSDAPGRSEAAPGRSQSSTTSAGSSSEQRDQPQRPATAGAPTNSQGSAQAPNSQTRSQKDSSQSATGTQNNETTGSKSTSEAPSGNRQQSTSGSAQPQGTQSGSGPAAQQNSTTQKNSSTQQSTSTGASTNAVTNLDTEKRTEVTRAFDSTSVNTVSNVSFNVSVGTTITEEVRLAPLPSDVVRLVPQYRGYNYVVVRDEIVIVEPKTRKIVEVIHKTGGSRKSASISLSSEQRKKFKTTVETTGSTRASTSSRIEIRQGMTLPEEVEILDVPQTIISEVPELRTYRYVTVGGEIALVEPGSRRVIEVIE
jgi:hypothetical protein